MQGFDDGSLEPSADPAIRKEYEAALGEFLLVFNYIEADLSELIRIAADKLGRPDLYKLAEESYEARLKYLDLLIVGIFGAGWQGLFAKLAAIGGKRNMVAHGHFNQNPFDGSYTIDGKRGSRWISPNELRSMAKEAARVAGEMGYLRAHFWFDELPPDAAPSP